MASTILSDNGVTSGSAGLKTTAASDGALALQTTTAGGTATTALTIDTSQNVGIGTASPAGRIDSYGDSTNPAGVFRRGGAYGNIESSDAGRANRWTIGRDNASTGNFVIAYNDSTKTSIDTSGNVLVGTTTQPSESQARQTLATSSSTYLQFARTATTIGGSLIGTSGQNFIVQTYTGAIGSETYTERMRIDSSGNVGIGTAGPTAKLDISNGGIKVSTGGYNLTMQGSASSGTLNGLFIAGVPRVTDDTGTFENTYIGCGASVGNIIFQQGNSSTTSSNTERMRIDSSGNVLVGSTSRVNDSILSATQSANTGGLGVLASNASYSATVICGSTSRASSSNFDFLGMYTNGTSTAQFRVGGNGVIYAQNTSVQSISDQRLKENIRDSSDGLAVVNALRPVRYDWKKGYGNDQKNQLGFIAQEIETVFPESVSEWQINKDEETTYKTVGPSALIPVLVKAIQELKAINDTQAETINALTARIVALEQA
jgi:hypothetical protein